MWVKALTWIELEESRFDEDGTLDPTLPRDLQLGLIEVDGVGKVDGMALFPETETDRAPLNGGNWNAG